MAMSKAINRRLLAVIGATCAGLAATAVLAAPAVAADEPFELTNAAPVCNLFTGESNIDWTFTSSFGKELTLTVDTPVLGTVTPDHATVPSASTDSKKQVLFQQELPAGTDMAEMSIHITADGLPSDISVSGEQAITCHKIDNSFTVDGVQGSCPAGGGATVTWTLTNHGEAAASFVGVDEPAPQGAGVRPVDFSIDPNETKVLTETTSAGSGTANITVVLILDIDLSGTKNQEFFTSQDVPFNCVSPSPSQAPSASASPIVSPMVSGSVGAVPVGGAETGGGGGRPVGSVMLGLGAVIVAAGAGVALQLARRRRRDA